MLRHGLVKFVASLTHMIASLNPWWTPGKMKKLEKSFFFFFIFLFYLYFILILIFLSKNNTIHAPWQRDLHTV